MKSCLTIPWRLTPYWHFLPLIIPMLTAFLHINLKKYYKIGTTCKSPFYLRLFHFYFIFLWTIPGPMVIRFKASALKLYFGMRRWFDPRWRFRVVQVVCVNLELWGIRFLLIWKTNSRLGKEQRLGDSSYWPHLTPNLAGWFISSICGQVYLN